MSKLVLGTVQFGLNYGIANTVGQVTVAEVRNILQVAEEAGIDTLDTAVNYGNSEQVLGEVGVKNFKVITKIPSAPKDLEELISGLKSNSNFIGTLGHSPIIWSAAT